jgi:hypothetical protein
MNGKIYKISSIHTDEIYIGSTCLLDIEDRLKGHILAYCAWIQRGYRRKYCSSFEILKYSDYKIELLADLWCMDKIELHKREGEYQLNNECVNINILHRPKNRNGIVFFCQCCKKEVSGDTYTNRWLHLKTPLHRKNRNDIHRLYNQVPLLPEISKNHVIDMEIYLERTLDIYYPVPSGVPGVLSI